MPASITDMDEKTLKQMHLNHQRKPLKFNFKHQKIFAIILIFVGKALVVQCSICHRVSVRDRVSEIL